jgi:xylulokinase
MKKYIVAADCGTTGSKAMIYDIEGKPIASHYREYGLEFPESGWVDQDSQMLYNTLLTVISQAVKTAGLPAEAIVAICLSTQRCTLVPVDKAGNPLRKGISWQDNRTDKQCEIIRQRIGADKFYDSTGLPIANVWTLPKIMWIRENEPDLYKKTYKFVNVQAYLNRLLGAEDFYDDFSNASLHGLMSVTKMEWMDDFVQAFEIDSNKLPQLVGSGRQVGKLNKSVADKLGLLIGTPIISGGGDQQCAAVGSNVIREGDCEVTLGTAGVTICSLDEPRLDPERTIPCLVHAVDGKWTCEGLQNAAGASLKWLRNLLQEGNPDGNNIDYDYITNLASKSTVGSNGLTFLPYLAGAAAPLWDSSARGTLFGMSLGSNLGDVSRAVLEGISFETASILDNFARREIKISKIHASGGGAKSTFWGQLQADIFGVPIQRLAVDDATILGAAVLGAFGTGVYNSISEAASAMVHTTSEYQPNMDQHQKYIEKRKTFDKLYSSIKAGGLF